MATQQRPFFLLLVLDGFGCRKEKEWNAIAQADTPVFSRLFHDCPWTTLEASGLRVGLPAGQMGNSEVGHLNIGAGRIVDQDIVRISREIDSGTIGRNPVFRDAVAGTQTRGGALHLVGLLSDGGVHSLQSHLHGLIAAAVAALPGNGDSPSVFVHAILDGRDTPPRSALKYVGDLLAFIDDKPSVHLSTVIGRYYAMDRDCRWERTRRAYDLYTLGIGTETRDVRESISRCYESGTTDEFMEPLILHGSPGSHDGRIASGDGVIFFNFRADRMRQIITALSDETFDGFERSVRPQAEIFTMTRYREDFSFPVLFPPQAVRNHLGEVFAAEGMKQLRIAETEKYAHVTFFFNGGEDRVSPGEDRVLVPSPKVATYDKKPEMSVNELAARVISEIDSRKYDVMVLNIANPDMVGHTGVMEATVEAIAATDAAVGRILEAVRRAGGVALITADHGNAELMYDPVTRQAHTAHTTNPVPLILVDPEGRFGSLRSGGALENVAPTILEILGIAKPAEMTADSLLVRE